MVHSPPFPVACHRRLNGHRAVGFNLDAVTPNPTALASTWRSCRLAEHGSRDVFITKTWARYPFMRATDLPTRDLLSINELTVEFSGRRRKQKVLRAVDGISFAIPKGSTVALVGESGSGKSTIGNAILGLVHASSGSVDFRGERIIDSSHIRRDLISSRIQVVFQDPYGSLNPSRTIGQTMIDPLLVKGRHFDGDKGVAVAEALKSVGL